MVPGYSKRSPNVAGEAKKKTQIHSSPPNGKWEKQGGADPFFNEAAPL